jgi:hypothetical protein
VVCSHLCDLEISIKKYIFIDYRKKSLPHISIYIPKNNLNCIEDSPSPLDEDLSGMSLRDLWGHGSLGIDRLETERIWSTG